MSQSHVATTVQCKHNIILACNITWSPFWKPTSSYIMAIRGLKFSRFSFKDKIFEVRLYAYAAYGRNYNLYIHTWVLSSHEVINTCYFQTTAMCSYVASVDMITVSLTRFMIVLFVKYVSFLVESRI